MSGGSSFHDLDSIFNGVKSSWVANTQQGHAHVPWTQLNIPFYFAQTEEHTEEEIEKITDFRIKFRRRYLKILATTIVEHDIRNLIDNSLVLVSSVFGEMDGMFFKSMNRAELMDLSSARKRLPHLVLGVVESVVSSIYCGGDMHAVKNNKRFNTTVRLVMEESFVRNVHPHEHSSGGFRYDKDLFVEICRATPFSITRCLVVTTSDISEYSSLIH